MNYYVPRIFNLPNFDATLSLLYDDTNEVRTFQAKREEGPCRWRSTSRSPSRSFIVSPIATRRLEFEDRSAAAAAASRNPCAWEWRHSIWCRTGATIPSTPTKASTTRVDLGLATKAFGSQTSFGACWGATRHTTGWGRSWCWRAKRRSACSPRSAFRSAPTRPTRSRCPNVSTAAAATPARIPGKSGGSARSAHRISAGRLRFVFQQHGIALSAVRREHQRRAV